jgi:pimeloyl-ACP methyl ester carboxylesterase
MSENKQPRGIFLRFVVAGLAIVALVTGLFQLHTATDGLRITRTYVGNTPVTVFRPPSGAAAPVVVIAHGFAGSQQLMQPFAETLARNGINAVTFDFLGHGRNPVPMRGNISEGETITSELLHELTLVAAFARKMPNSDGRLAVLGHSMASDIVVRFAQATPDVQATVAVSVFSPVVTATSPRNLLVIVGALEPSMLRDEGLRIVNLAAAGKAVAGETYGNFPDGSARRLVLASGVEHIGVLYGRDSMVAALRWINAAFGRREDSFVDSRGRWLALVFIGLVALAWPLSKSLPMSNETPVGANLTWKPLLIAAVAPAILTPLTLWKMPTDFLPILLGDYLTLHFLLYGLLTASILLFWRTRQQALDRKVQQSGLAALAQAHGMCAGQSREAHPASKICSAGTSHTHSTSLKNIAVAAVLVATYNIIAFGLPIDAYVFSFLPIPARIPLIAAIACGTVPYFIADEWLTRGAQPRRGAYALTKLCFLISLGIAVALNPMKLFFLVIIVPAILLLFLAFGLVGRWSYAATRHPLPGALANAAVFAWGIAVTFPMIVR